MSGIIAYSNQEKIRALGVLPETILRYGAVSEEVGCEMAERVRAQTRATYGIATTGVAGPTGGTADKPVGTVFVALAKQAERTRCERFFFPNDRETFKELVAQHAFDLLRRQLL